MVAVYLLDYRFIEDNVFNVHEGGLLHALQFGQRDDIAARLPRFSVPVERARHEARTDAFIFVSRELLKLRKLVEIAALDILLKRLRTAYLDESHLFIDVSLQAVGARGEGLSPVRRTDDEIDIRRIRKRLHEVVMRQIVKPYLRQNTFTHSPISSIA